MHTYRNSLVSRLLLALLLTAAMVPVHAAETTTDPTAAVSASPSPVQTRYVGEFGAFAGSDENAQSLYNGLRSGSSITLAGPASGGTSTTTVQIDPPTGSMGNGNAFISTALARQQLANHGITDPTPQQLQAALTGGTIQPADPSAAPVELKGVLVQRADGMGWGNIARDSGMNLGRIVSSMRSQKSATLQADGIRRGVTTAAGTAVPPGGGSRSAAESSGHGRSALAPSRGIVTAAGGPVRAGGVMTHGGGRPAGAGVASGAGITTFSGVSGPGRSGQHAQGQGKGLAKH